MFAIMETVEEIAVDRRLGCRLQLALWGDGKLREVGM
jgi:hypothetical protein